MDKAIAQMEASKANTPPLPDCLQDTSKQLKEGEYEQTLFSPAVWFEVTSLLSKATVPSFAGLGGTYRQEYLFTTVPANLSYYQFIGQVDHFVAYKKSKGMHLDWGVIFYDGDQKKIVYGVKTTTVKNLASLPEIIEVYGEDFQHSEGIGKTSFVLGIWIVPSSISHCKHHQFQYMKYGMVPVDSLIVRLSAFANGLRIRGIHVQTFLYEFAGTHSWLLVPDTHLKTPNVGLYVNTDQINNPDTQEIHFKRQHLSNVGNGKLFALSFNNLFVDGVSSEVYYEYLSKVILNPGSMKAPISYHFLKATLVESNDPSPYLLKPQ